MNDYVDRVNLDIDAEQSGFSLGFSIDTSDLTNYPEKFSFHHPSFPFLLYECLENVPAMLAGNRCLVVKFEEYAIFAEGDDRSETVTLDVRTWQDQSWEQMNPGHGYTATFTRFPVSVSRDALADELIETTRAYVDTADELDPPEATYRRRLRVAQQALDYYREHGSLEGYERSYPRETVEEVLFGDGKDADVERYAVEAGLVRAIVLELLAQDDADHLTDRLNVLLIAGHELQAEVFEQLLRTVRENPDERIGDAIAYPLYLSNPRTKRLAIEALARVGVDDDMTVPMIRSLIESGDEPEVREAAAEAVATLGDHEAVERLERAVEDDPDEDVREAAERALAELR
jgi:hypothetical protein